TGAWTVQSAAELGIPLAGIAEALFARSLSSKPEQREAVTALKGLRANDVAVLPVAQHDEAIEDIRQALYASKIVAYSQGFDLIRAGAEQYGWDIELGAMARIWRGGCIIRARFLNRITEAYVAEPALPLLLAAPYFREALGGTEAAWRRVVRHAFDSAVPAPAFAASL